MQTERKTEITIFTPYNAAAVQTVQARVVGGPASWEAWGRDAQRSVQVTTHPAGRYLEITVQEVGEKSSRVASVTIEAPFAEQFLAAINAAFEGKT